MDFMKFMKLNKYILYLGRNVKLQKKIVVQKKSVPKF